MCGASIRGNAAATFDAILRTSTPSYAAPMTLAITLRALACIAGGVIELKIAAQIASAIATRNENHATSRMNCTACPTSDVIFHATKNVTEIANTMPTTNVSCFEMGISDGSSSKLVTR